MIGLCYFYESNAVLPWLAVPSCHGKAWRRKNKGQNPQDNKNKAQYTEVISARPKKNGLNDTIADLAITTELQLNRTSCLLAVRGSALNSLTDRQDDTERV